MDNNCPLNPQGHRYFVFKTFETFEPVQVPSNGILYRKVEYAVMGCNCSATVKRTVKNGDNAA